MMQSTLSRRRTAALWRWCIAMHIAGQCGKEANRRHMFFPVQNRLIQMRNAPSLRDMIMEYFRQFLGCLSRNGGLGEQAGERYLDLQSGRCMERFTGLLQRPCGRCAETIWRRITEPHSNILLFLNEFFKRIKMQHDSTAVPS